MKIVIIDDDISFLEMFNKKINSSMKKIFDQVIIDIPILIFFHFNMISIF